MKLFFVIQDIMIMIDKRHHAFSNINWQLPADEAHRTQIVNSDINYEL